MNSGCEDKPAAPQKFANTMNGGGVGGNAQRWRLPAKAVQGAALALEGVHDVQSSHGLAASVFRVGDSVANDGLEEDL